MNAKALRGACLTVIALLIAGPALAGCGLSLSTASSSAAPAGSGVPGSAPAVASVPTGVVDLQQGGQSVKPPSGFTCPNQSLRGCFTESDMVTYFEYVLPYVDEFFKQTWPSLPLPSNVYFISDGATTNEACEDSNGNTSADDQSYEYCPADHNVYIGQQLAWALYSQAGDVAPATGIAHEFGHGVQTQIGVPSPQSDAETLVHENQADCVSGAWLGFANNQHLLQQSDEPVLQKYLELISSSENDPNRTHGDFTERGDAVEAGGEKGIASCDSFYPATPIVGS
jgi:hypothetical protein